LLGENGFVRLSYASNILYVKVMLLVDLKWIGLVIQILEWNELINRLNTINTEIWRITQISNEKYILVNNEIHWNCKTTKMTLAQMVVAISEKRCGCYMHLSEHNGLQWHSIGLFDITHECQNHGNPKP